MKQVTVQDIIKKVAYLDGSLRDIYVYNVILEDWDLLIKLLKRLYILETDEKVIPNSINEILSIREERGFMIRVIIGSGVTANCHFFCSENEPSPIEFDIDPREIQSQYSMEKVLEFMRQLGEGLNRDVFLTEENTEEAIFLSYTPISKDFSYFF